MKTFFAFLFLLFTGCSNSVIDDIVNEARSQQYRYSFTDNGCSTGDHSFTSMESMCDTLQNDQLNNNCARELRRSKFQADCYGRGSF